MNGNASTTSLDCTAHNGQTPYEALRDKLQSVVHRIYECRVHDVHFAVIHLEDSNVVLKCVCDHF